MASLRVVVKGKNLEITPALRAYAEKKVAKFERFSGNDREVVAEFTLRTEKERHIAELTLVLNGIILRGESTTDDMYGSIDEAIDRVERRFNRYKSRIQKKLQGPKLSEVSAKGDTEADDTEVKLGRVVRTKRFAVKPMDVEEAVMQMELLGHSFFVFQNATSDEVNVVYKRRDGNYGLIEPELA